MTYGVEGVLVDHTHAHPAAARPSGPSWGGLWTYLNFLEEICLICFSITDYAALPNITLSIMQSS